MHRLARGAVVVIHRLLPVVVADEEVPAQLVIGFHDGGRAVEDVGDVYLAIPYLLGEHIRGCIQLLNGPWSPDSMTVLKRRLLSRSEPPPGNKCNVKRTRGINAM